MLTTISVKLPAGDVRRIPTRNRSAFIREAVKEKLDRQQKQWKPKTAFGKKLMVMSQRYQGKPLTVEEVNAELRERSGLR
jgi:Arc/MetJ-type ribon-helix-helix transcriptional regulator